MKGGYLQKQPVHLTDRTLSDPGIMKENLQRENLLHFCMLLQGVGIQKIEISLEVLDILAPVPCNLLLLLRVNSKEELLRGMEQGILDFICTVEVWEGMETDDYLFPDVQMTLEYSVRRWSDLTSISLCKEWQQQGCRCIRLAGLIDPVDIDILDLFISMVAEDGWSVDACPYNNTSQAVSAALDAVIYGACSISGTFCGWGTREHFAPLEEVLTALYLLDEFTIPAGDLALLPRLGSEYEKLTGCAIPLQKPVIGERIFWYESGIHADGISKDPATYEPFPPALVGKTRRLVLGKHSGIRAVREKLKELGVLIAGAEEQLLQQVKHHSMKLQRGLYTDEILEIAGKMHQRIGNHVVAGRDENGCKDCGYHSAGRRTNGRHCLDYKRKSGSC